MSGVTLPKVRWVERHDLPFMWVDVAALDAACKLDAGFYLPVGAGAYWDLRAPAELQMPIVAFGDDGSAFFQDGRHRFAWMRDSGRDACRSASSTSTGLR